MADKPRMLDARFELLSPIGSGAMGTVYRSWDHEGGGPVAIKLLHAVETSDRFDREARVLSQIDHPHIVRYVAHGMTTTGEAWLAMEWLDGVDLSSYLKTRGHPLTPRETVLVGRAVAAGLSWAHERGFIHRDMKPGNVLIPDGELAFAKVVDFGLARDVAHDEVITKTGALIGTLDYMPPEQLTDAKRVNARADVFSLGAVMYRCLTGRAPVVGKTLPELVLNIVKKPIPPITDFRPDVPPPLVNLIAWMLQKNAEERPVNATPVLPALEALERGFQLENEFEAATVLTARPDSAHDAPAPAWQALEGTGTLRMDQAELLPPAPLLVPTSQSTKAPTVPSASGSPIVAPRRDGLNEWLPVVLLAIVTLALVAAALYR
jgi:serine/threonine protein kinase